jgi:hypothetical protein
MKARIFSHKGVVGAITDLENGKFLNDPKAKAQLGCVISTDEVQITKEAKEIIKGAPREGGSFAAIMLTKHHESIVETKGKSSIGLMGYGYHVFNGPDLCISRDCDLSVLEDCEEVDLEVPSDFIQLVDTMVG